MILINKTYQIVTQESAEQGEVAEQGFLYEDSEYSFKELVEIMQEYRNGSCYPMNGSAFEWLSNDSEEDYSTGDIETQSIHYSRNNNARSLKYWRKAMIVAGVVKGE